MAQSGKASLKRGKPSYFMSILGVTLVLFLLGIIGWLVIIGQSFGSIALITGCLGRIAAAGNFIIFTGALLTHAKGGWTMNWFSKKKGEGIEYFILLLAILLVVILKGSGPFSIDQELLKLISH